MTDELSQPAVFFRLLGPLAVELGGRAMEMRSRRARKMIAVLALNANTGVHVDRLVDVLWDDPPYSARQQISNVVVKLRQALIGADRSVMLGTTHDGYQLNVPPDWVDAMRFERLLADARRSQLSGDTPHEVSLLTESLGYWRGPALGGLAEGHLGNIALRLEDLRLAALEQLMQARLAAGEAQRIVSDLIELVAQHPFHESFRASLMLALWQESRRSEALTVFEDGRRLLADELGISPGPALAQAHELVLTGDATATGATRLVKQSSALRTTAAMDTSGPMHCFLPRSSPEFTGRGNSAAALVETALRDSRDHVAVAVVDGMGGIGKTTLAIHVAHQLARSFPDGQYFVDLHGFSADAEPLTSVQGLRQLLRQCATPLDEVPSDVDGCSALWRARLAGKRALVLLDNAADVTRVRSLLPGTQGSCVIVTSRQRMAALEGATLLSLAVPPPDEAIDLFMKIVGRTRLHGAEGMVAVVVELCGRLPLAVRIAAARFRERNEWTIDDLIAKLRHRNQRLRFLATGDCDVAAVLSLSYRYLPPKLLGAFRRLSLHPGGFEVSEAASLIETSVEHAESILESLYDANLLIHLGEGRYQVDNLIRDFTADLLERDESPVTWWLSATGEN